MRIITESRARAETDRHIDASMAKPVDLTEHGKPLASRQNVDPRYAIREHSQKNPERQPEPHDAELDRRRALTEESIASSSISRERSETGSKAHTGIKSSGITREGSSNIGKTNSTDSFGTGSGMTRQVSASGITRESAPSPVARTASKPLHSSPTSAPPPSPTVHGMGTLLTAPSKPVPSASSVEEEDGEEEEGEEGEEGDYDYDYDVEEEDVEGALDV